MARLFLQRHREHGALRHSVPRRWAKLADHARWCARGRLVEGRAGAVLSVRERETDADRRDSAWDVFGAGAPRLLFEGDFFSYGGPGFVNYDVALDRKRFLMPVNAGTESGAPECGGGPDSDDPGGRSPLSGSAHPRDWRRRVASFGAL